MGAPIDDAKKLIAEGKFGEAEVALEPLLAEAVPSTEALALALRVSIADGRLVTAERRVKALLERGVKDPKFVLVAADVARQSGDVRLKHDRLMFYLQLRGDEKDDAVANALYRLLVNGDRTDALGNYIRLYGADKIAWDEGRRMLRRQIDRRQGSDATRTLLLLLDSFSAADHVAKLNYDIRDTLRVFGANVRAIAAALMLHELPTDFFRRDAWRELDETKGRVGPTAILTGQVKSGKMWPVAVQSRLEYIASINDEERRKSLYQQLVDSADRYMSAEDPEYAVSFLRAVMKEPKQLTGGLEPVATYDDYVAWFDAASKRWTHQPQKLSSFVAQLVED